MKLLKILLGLVLGYVAGAAIGAGLVEMFSTNTHDKALEVGMTAFFSSLARSVQSPAHLSASSARRAHREVHHTPSTPPGMVSAQSKLKGTSRQSLDC